MTAILATVLVGYLIGSVPVAYLMARAWGVNIFTVGTGNPGAANVFRTVGRTPGFIVFAADVLKGAGAVALAGLIGIDPAELRIVAGAAVVVGHWYPLFLRFRGGAGLAPAIGLGLGALPLAFLVGVVPGLVVLHRHNSTGHAAGVAFITFLLAGLAQGRFTVALTVTAVAALVMLHARFVASDRSMRQPPA